MCIAYNVGSIPTVPPIKPIGGGKPVPIILAALQLKIINSRLLQRLYTDRRLTFRRVSRNSVGLAPQESVLVG